MLVEEAQAVGGVIAQHDRPHSILGAGDPDLVLDVLAHAARLGAQIMARVVAGALQ